MTSSFLYHHGYEKMMYLPLSRTINENISGYYGSIKDSEWEYKESGKFRDLLSEDFRICVPGTYNTITLVPNDDGVLEVAGTALIGDDYTELDWYEETDKIKEQINEEITKTYKELIALRKNDKTLVYGDFEVLNKKKDRFVYSRTLNGTTYVIDCNLGKKQQKSYIPEGYKPAYLSKNSICHELSPYEVRIWVKKA
jgi:hypothetical protein